MTDGRKGDGKSTGKSGHGVVDRGITAFAGVIINYLKRDDVRGTYLASHFDWQIKTFWFTLLGSIIGILLLPVGVGGLVLLLVSLWFIYRIIKGWLVFNDGREIASGLF